MNAEVEVNESFNGWQFLGIVGALVVLGLMPYLAWIIKLIFL